MSVHQRRAAAIAETVAEVRGIETKFGVTHAALDAIKARLVALASRTELFPPEHFQVPEGEAGRIYRLSEDADHRFALYASASAPGKAQPPHNHTTWAVIAGVHGEEHNVFYERIDNRAQDGVGTIRRTGEQVVRKGNAVGFLPDDFHTIELKGPGPLIHLHMYGLSLEHLPGRIAFSSASGGAYRIFPPASNIREPVVTATELKAMLRDGQELALLDVREEGVYSDGHLLFATAMPLSRLELRAPVLVPRLSTRIVLVDGGEGLAQRAASRLRLFGYTDLSVLEGGVPAWRAAGFEVFTGVNVPSKAFGEVVEHTADTPRVTAEELKRRVDAGEDLVILDSRPLDEYRRMSIPGGIDCPGAELVHRIHDVAPDPGTLVVVNCAGRTRSIIGAQSLINSGIPNKVVALKDGTMGWKLAGFTLDKGKTAMAPAPSPEGVAKARAAARAVAEKAGVRFIDAGALAGLVAEGARGLYLLDVRTPEEFAAGHLIGSRHAPGGQLVQATDEYVGARHARIVLVDGEGVRAPMTGSWLRQLGWDDVFVLENALACADLETGPDRPPVLGLDGVRAETISAGKLKDALETDTAVVVDLAGSLTYRAGHIPGAWFAIRARFGESLKALPAADLVVLTSPDGILARLAAADAGAALGRPVRVLDGGTAAWTAAGFSLTADDPRWADKADDLWYKPYDRSEGVEAAMKNYLSWEVDLVGQIERDGDARFRVLKG